MIHLTASTPVLLATQAADFRKGIDGFIALCRQRLQEDPRNGSRFVFINRARTMIRVLTYDGSGFWLMTKRLSKGRFDAWPTAGKPVNPVTAKQLRMLLHTPNTSHEKGQPNNESVHNPLPND